MPVWPSSRLVDGFVGQELETGCPGSRGQAALAPQPVPSEWLVEAPALLPGGGLGHGPHHGRRQLWHLHPLPAAGLEGRRLRCILYCVQRGAPGGLHQTWLRPHVPSGPPCHSVPCTQSPTGVASCSLTPPPFTPDGPHGHSTDGPYVCSCVAHGSRVPAKRKACPPSVQGEHSWQRGAEAPWSGAESPEDRKESRGQDRRADANARAASAAQGSRRQRLGKKPFSLHSSSPPGSGAAACLPGTSAGPLWAGPRRLGGRGTPGTQGGVSRGHSW